MKRTTCTLETELEKFHLNHLILANNRCPPLPLAQGILPKIKSTISNEHTIGEGMQYIFVRAMDAHWQRSKVCDVGVTFSRAMDARWKQRNTVENE
jgi:hypothetical protein